jgi:hypothetical protein
VTSPEFAAEEVAEPEESAGSAVAAGPTGHPTVDAALAALAETTDRPPAEQVGAYEETHRALSQTLSAIDQS